MLVWQRCVPLKGMFQIVGEPAHGMRVAADCTDRHSSSAVMAWGRVWHNSVLVNGLLSTLGLVALLHLCCSVPSVRWVVTNTALSLSVSLCVCVCVFAVCVLQRACVCAYVPDEKLLSCEQFAVCVCFCVSVFVRGRCEPGEVRAHVRVKMFRV